MNEQMLWLAAITLLAATVNGALGYGFSSITVPLALLFLSNRVLNPALIVIEVPLNAYVLWVNRASLGSRVAAGRADDRRADSGHRSPGRCMVSSVSPDWLKLCTYLILLPLILLQAAGFRRPIQAERSAGLASSAPVSACSTRSPPSRGRRWRLRSNNQGLEKREFRAALGLVRLAESSMTAVAYIWAGLFTASEFRAGAVDCAQRRDRCSHRRADHPADAPGDVPPHLHELRCLGGGIRSVEAGSRPAISSRRALPTWSSSQWSSSTRGCCIRFFSIGRNRAAGRADGRRVGGRRVRRQPRRCSPTDSRRRLT